LPDPEKLVGGHVTATVPLTFKTAFSALEEGKLDGAMAEHAFDALLCGTWTQVQIAGFLTALRLKGESSEVIAGAARALRANMLGVEHNFPKLLDTCGTGGDETGTVNLSTGAALICASLGVPVAKHGNRAVSSRAGSADVVSALGIPIDLPADAASRVLVEANIAFLMAPTHHPAMRHAAPIRKDLGIRTIFNCLGPLANPARATHQLIGAFSDELRPVLARTLDQLGTVRAWVVRGEDGIDEVSPYGATRVTVLDGGKLSELLIHPSDFGMATSPKGAAAGGTADENARIIEAVLSGQDHPARDAFVLNAAAALVVAEDLPPRVAAEKAMAAVVSGKAVAALQRWRDAALANKPVSA
jgi:anthranilate phosphoribosyltransferase